MVAQTPDYFEAFDLEFAEEQAYRAEWAAEAAAEAAHEERMANQRALLAEIQAHFAAYPALRVMADADRQAGPVPERDSYGDWLAQQAEELAEGDEGDYPDPTDEQLCGIR